MTPVLPDAERFARIRLLRSPHVGPVTYYHLLSRFGSAQAALPAMPDLAARGGGRYVLVAEDKITAEFEAAERAGVRPNSKRPNAPARNTCFKTRANIR